MQIKQLKPSTATELRRPLQKSRINHNSKINSPTGQFWAWSASSVWQNRWCYFSSSHTWSLTHCVVDVSLRPHHVMFLIDDFGSTEHVQILHYILLHVCQGGDLREITCSNNTSDSFNNTRVCVCWRADENRGNITKHLTDQICDLVLSQSPDFIKQTTWHIISVDLESLCCSVDECGCDMNLC